MSSSGEFYSKGHLNNYENFGFFIMKKLLDLAHEKLVNILGGLRKVVIEGMACQLPSMTSHALNYNLP